MPNQFQHKHSYSRYFMAPVWIALALSGMGAAFLLGEALVTDEWAREDNEKLVEYQPGSLFVGPAVGMPVVNAKSGTPGGAVGPAETPALKPESVSTALWRSPASGLEWAAEGVKHDRIEFAIYRNLLRAALAQQEADAHELAFRSIRDVLQSGGAFADDLKAELKGLAPQVFIATTNSAAGVAAGNALEKELRDLGMTVVIREARDSAQIGGSKVSCYSVETCKDAEKRLIPLLRDRGYGLVEADASSRAEDSSDDMAAALYGAKVIRVALPDPKLTQISPVTAIKSPSLQSRPKKDARRHPPSSGGVRTADR